MKKQREKLIKQKAKSDVVKVKTMEIGGWETLKQRVKRNYQIPTKAKLEWMRDMFEFNNKHKLALRLKVRQITSKTSSR